MKLEWINDMHNDIYKAKVHPGELYLHLTRYSGQRWIWSLTTEWLGDWCDACDRDLLYGGPGDWPLVEGAFKAKDLEAAKFEAVERALKWARKLVEKLERVG